ncbi:MAG: type II toxin-antitoxin system Phd/YefM family antitoxin [Chloroflexi bacterium]|nr:type II toxin-antitoxin system Phd/YefM family antitoxin [Chloroflexota bacterium]
MTRTLSITEARDRLTRLPDELAGEHEALTITRYGEPVLAILPFELYESIIETLDVMGDPALMAALRDSAQDIVAGRTVALEELEAETEAERS